MFSTIVNTLIENGFTIQRMAEPTADAAILAKYPQFEDSRHKPDFLLIKACKL
ncbi:hypothetical protein SAMN02910369_01880 [Lachnospiraceae bacterium NE2001]|nr:hypothetical protein SAMN02910369_01880 [Lachnospiraceae bacterium NE2001]